MLAAFCYHHLSVLPPLCPYFPVPKTSWLGIVASMPALQTIMGDLMSSFIPANEMLANPVLGIQELHLNLKTIMVVAAFQILRNSIFITNGHLLICD